MMNQQSRPSHNLRYCVKILFQRKTLLARLFRNTKSRYCHHHGVAGAEEMMFKYFTIFTIEGK